MCSTHLRLNSRNNIRIQWIYNYFRIGWFLSFLPGLVEKLRLAETDISPHIGQSEAGGRITVNNRPPANEGHHPAAGHTGAVKVGREGEGETDHFGAADDGVDDKEDNLVGETLRGHQHAAVEERHAVAEEHGGLGVAEGETLLG